MQRKKIVIYINIERNGARSDFFFGWGGGGGEEGGTTRNTLLGFE